MAKDENKKVKNENKNFFKNLKAELKKVIWPTPKQLVNSTVAVITIVIITALIVVILDVAFDFCTKFGIGKVRTMVNSNTTNVIENNIDENQEKTDDQKSEEQNQAEPNNEATENVDNGNSTNNENPENTTTENVAQ